MSSISIENLSKTYPNGFQAVQSLNLDVAEGEFMVLVGPSGCGKTTALRMVAGLEEITGGTLKIGERVANHLSSKERDVAMVFQNYALYPHMTVGENIAFGLELRKTPKEEIRRKVEEAAEILLLDEPLSNLDAKLRVQMRTEVHRIQRRIGVATLYVTHDQTEAMTMGDRVAVMRAGVLQQCDQPQVLYRHPANLFVAAFIGSPAMNLFEATLGADGTSLRLGSQELALGEELLRQRPGLAAYRGRPLVVGLRAEDLPVAGSSEPSSSTLKARVEVVEELGSEMLVHFSIDAVRVSGEGPKDEEQLERVAGIDIVGEGIARVEPRARVAAGEDTVFSVYPERLHFFDAQSQLAIAG